MKNAATDLRVPDYVEIRTKDLRNSNVPITTATPDCSVLFRCKLGIYVKVFETRQLGCWRLTPESLGDCNTEYVNTDYWFIGCDAVLFGVWRVFFLCTSVRISDGRTDVIIQRK